MSLTAALAGERRDLVWIDYKAYVQRLLGSPIPWLDVDALIAWQRTALGLIDSDVLEIDATAVFAAWIDAHPELATAMAARKRTIAPLRALFEDAGLRALLTDLGGSLRSAFAGRTIALVIGAPDTLAALAYRAAFGTDPGDLDEDDIDGAAVYVADLLRSLAEAGLDALVVDAPRPGEALTADRADLYGPIRNTAGHYRWALGYVSGTVPAVPAAQRPSFWLAGEPAPDVPTGIVVDPAFWAGADPAPVPERGFRFLSIPADAQPESVLARIRTLE